MRKDRLYSELTEKEKLVADACLKAELWGLDFKHPLRLLHLHVWDAYQNEEFRYDGPTFSKSKHDATVFELAALVHDFRNATGYVGKEVDREMFDIMITCNYPLELIIQRWHLTRFTFLNVWRHKLKGTFRNSKPTNLYTL
jgi:hypothetical protein